MNKKLRKIINHYGINKQLKYFQSEIFELNEAIIKERKSNGAVETALDSVLGVFGKAGLINYKTHYDYDKEHITEEIADVMVMLKQFQLYYNISSQDIRNVMDSKVKRKLESMEAEYEPKHA